MNEELIRLQAMKLEKLERDRKEREGLPHLHAFGGRRYKWAREFSESRDKIRVLTAANQIGKSSENIRLCIDWATRPEIWAELWPQVVIEEKQKPSQFWYLYPSKDVATIEFEEKWMQYLPRNEYKDHPVYGWKAVYDNKKIMQIDFNSGVTVYFKTYAQNAQDLQSGSVHAMFPDEEVPAHLFDELSMRVSAVDGYMSFVFTATLCQPFWKYVVEDKTKLPEARVWQISLYDCQYYDDGTPSKWTKERIERQVARCSTEAEVQRRVFGKFVADTNLKYPSFSEEKNVRPYHPLPKNWFCYAAIDNGGGGSSHPPGITVIAVDPDFTKGRLVRAWRGDGIGNLTAEDVIKKYLELVAGLTVVITYYDQAAKDLYTIASRLGIALKKSEKGHSVGETTLNTLFKNGMLVLYTYHANCPVPADFLQTEKLVDELKMLLNSTDKRHAKDDLVDPTRYISVSVPWNWEAGMKLLEEKELARPPTLNEMRRQQQELNKARNDLEEEIEFWNELYDVTE